jgi:phosphate transport system substrate-binding protein
MRNFKSILMGSVAIASISVASQPAHALFAFGDGSTAAQIAYRQLMDCLYNQAQGTPGGGGANGGPLALAAACPGANGSGFGGEMLYAGTGSGNGKNTIISNSVSTISVPSNSIPWSDSTIGITAVTQYDGVQFAGTDDPVNSTDVASYASARQAAAGNLIQIPSFIIPIALGFNSKDGAGAALHIVNATPTGGSSGLNLSRQALCGIASGHITQWNNPILTALNGGSALGTGNITFVHRSDGSGSTFLLTNALATQCYAITGPQNESNSTVVSYAFPWTDHTAACPVAPVGVGTDQANFPDQFATDQCGNAVANPGGGHFANASGSGAVASLVGSTNGAIGYASVDFWAPIMATGSKTANLQGQWAISHGQTTVFTPATAGGAQSAMSERTPNFPGTTITDPISWSLQGVDANPVQLSSYPISGFTWLLMYQCYQPHANGNNAFNWFRTWIDFLYGSTTATNIINANGFAATPGPWVTQVYTLLTGANGPQFTGSGTCSGKTGAY